MLNTLVRRTCYVLYLALMGTYFEVMDQFRARLLRRMINAEAPGLVVRAGVLIAGYRKLEIGRNVSINYNCFMSCDGGLKIGNDVSIAHGVSILTTEHGFSDATVPIKSQPVSFHQVVIGNNVWIGAKATILAGVALADGTVVAAGAVVTKSVIVKNTIVAGVPARFLKNRLT